MSDSDPTHGLGRLGAAVDWPDHESAAATREAAGPGLGKVAELAEWLSGVQGVSPPTAPRRARLVVFGLPAGPHVHELAARYDVHVREIVDLPAGVPAAIDAGGAVADDEADSGTDLLIAARAGSLDTATVAVSVLTGAEPVKVLARGAAATDPDAWMAHAVAIRDARRAAMPFRRQPDELLDALGDPAFAATAGFVLRAAARRTPVLLDGPVAAAAALTAYESQPRAVRWWAAADTARDPAHALSLTTLSLRTVLDLALVTGDGTAGLLALPVLVSAGLIVRGGVR